jgi:hypothetical protein
VDRCVAADRRITDVTEINWGRLQSGFGALYTPTGTTVFKPLNATYLTKTMERLVQWTREIISGKKNLSSRL